MKIRTQYSFPFFILFVLSGLLVSCEQEINKEPFSKGDLNVESYLAIGNSISAGVVSSGLTPGSQQNSFPNLIANQLETLGGGSFTQPTIPEGNGTGYRFIENIDTTNCGDSNISFGVVEADPSWINNVSNLGPFNNLAVPGLSINEIGNSNFATNPLNPSNFMLRMLATDQTNTSYLSLVESTVAELDPSFYTIWLGNNDVLSYAATGGGFIDSISIGAGILAVDISAPEFGTPTLTNSATFKENLGLLLDMIDPASDKQGMIATIPDIRSIPFFTTLTNRFTIPDSTYLYFKNPIDSCKANMNIWFKTGEGNNIDTVKARNVDFITLLAADHIGKLNSNGEPFGLHPNNPLYNAYVLDNGEASNCGTALLSFNNSILDEAEQRNIPVIDLKTYFNSIVLTDENREDGVTGEGFNGIKVNSEFLTGGFFSLDGIHPTQRGNGIIANKWIQELNAVYNANIPEIDISKIPGINFPD